MIHPLRGPFAQDSRGLANLGVTLVAACYRGQRER